MNSEGTEFVALRAAAVSEECREQESTPIDCCAITHSQMQKLFRTPMTEYQTIFDQVDAQSGEILSLMRNLDSQIAFTRKQRDELHTRFMDWEELLVKWVDVTIERSNANEQLIKTTYRFLAQRYLKTNVWKRE